MLVDSQPDLAFVGEAGNGREGIELAESTHPDVVLMDIRMPVMDGIEATERIVASAERRGSRDTAGDRADDLRSRRGGDPRDPRRARAASC